MASKVQIANLALARLGAARITSLTDGTETANLCNTLFDDIAEEVMSDGAWTSTIRRQQLNKLVATPAFEYTYQYQLPTNPKCLKVLSMNDVYQGDIDYRIEGDKLLTDEGTVKIKYVAKITDTQSYDVRLKRAIVSRMAAELAYALTGQNSVARAMMEVYDKDVSDGLAIDGQQGTNDFAPSNDLTDVR